MADKPILFSGPMVRAILEYRKTQTRRILKPQPDDIMEAQIPKALRISAGDRLWVREAWKPHSSFDHLPPRDMPGAKVFYLADPGYSPSGSRGRPGIHMPRKYSRITLEVLAVKVERLQDISGNDAQAEGILIGGADVDVYRRESERNHEAARRWNAYRIRQFRDLWASINGPGSWDANPWVVAYEFEPILQNIDGIEHNGFPSPSREEGR
jgi:hypothetical protein